MKEVYYRNRYGYNPSKKEVSFEEVSDFNVNRVSKKWISKCFIRDSFYSRNKEDLEKWIESRRKCIDGNNVHILRHLDTKKGINMILCKSVLDIFLIENNTAYQVLYVKELKIKIDESK